MGAGHGPGAGPLRHLLAAGQTPAASPFDKAQDRPFKLMQVSVGNSIRMVPIGEELYFEAADKCLRVLAVSHEYLIRMPLKGLLPQLDPQLFWRIHRSTVVQAQDIASVHRDDAGKLPLSLPGLLR